MGLKWFRARLSMEKEASKIPTMTGLYRKVSYLESDLPTIQKNKVSDATSSTINDSKISTNNEIVEYNHSKAADPMSSSSSLLIINSKKHDNHATENTESSISTKNINIKEQPLIPKLISEQLNKNQSGISDIKPGICSDNEIVI